MARQTPAHTSNDYQVHKLKGRPLRQWWQVADIIAFRRKSSEQDKFQNQAIRSHLVFFATLPFAIALILHTIGIAYAALILLPLLLLIPLAIHLVGAYKRHARRVIEVQNLTNYLILKSPWLEKRIMLSEVRDFFPIAYGDYILECNNGEYFVLSAELTDSDRLFAQIKKTLPGKESEGGSNYLVPGSLTDGMEMACLAVLIAVASPYAQRLAGLILNVKPSTNATTFDVSDLAAIVLSICLAIFCLVCRNMILSRFAEIVRLNNSRCIIRTRQGYSTIPVERIKSVKRALGHIVVRHNDGWFFTLVDNNESTKEKLLELNQNALRSVR